MKINKLICSLLFSVLFTGAYADSSIESQIHQMLPQTPTDKITPINSNITEVLAGNNAFYVMKWNESQVIVGHLINIQDGTDLTQQGLDAIKNNKLKFNDLPLNLAIKVGNGNKKIAVFLDPDCPYCKKYEELISKNIKHLTVYYFMLPLAMHPQALPHSQQIMCANNPAQVIKTIMIDNQEVTIKPSQKCNSEASQKINQISNLAGTLGINGTPLSITENNVVINGYDTVTFNNFIESK